VLANASVNAIQVYRLPVSLREHARSRTGKSFLNVANQKTIHPCFQYPGRLYTSLRNAMKNLTFAGR
jgi:hypothetical protein